MIFTKTNVTSFCLCNKLHLVLHRNTISDKINTYDQKQLNKLDFDCTEKKHISNYETSDALIKKLFKNSNKQQNAANKNTIDIKSMEYREKLIKYAYGLIHLKEWSKIEVIIKKYIDFNNLNSFEINFFLHLNNQTDSTQVELNNLLINNCMFVFEKILIEKCTDLIKITENSEVLKYLENILFDKSLSKIKQVMSKNTLFKLKIRRLFFELYTFSFCNKNVLKFHDLLIKQ